MHFVLLGGRLLRAGCWPGYWLVCPAPVDAYAAGCFTHWMEPSFTCVTLLFPLQYYFYPLEEAMAEAGFKHVQCQELDPRHRIVLGARL